MFRGGFDEIVAEVSAGQVSRPEAVLQEQAGCVIPSLSDAAVEPEFAVARQLAETVIAMTGSGSRLIFLPLPENDPRQRRPDIGKARELLGWQPTVELERGLHSTIAYFRHLLANGLESDPARRDLRAVCE